LPPEGALRIIIEERRRRMTRHSAILVMALSALRCGGGQSGTEDNPPAPESLFEIITGAGERLSDGEGGVHVAHQEAGPPLAELAVTGVDAEGATWGVVFGAEGDGLIGTYEASVSTAPTGVGIAAVSRHLDGVALEASESVLASSGTVRAEVLQGATGLELRGEVDAPELGFSFQGPMHFSCSVPHELLPGSPAPPVPDDPAARPVLITDTKLETSLCRDFMLGGR
jgi:hypothetical protein